MIRAKNYEAVSKFVKVMTKIRWPLFFPDTVYNSVVHNQMIRIPLNVNTENYTYIIHEILNVNNCCIKTMNYR